MPCRASGGFYVRGLDFVRAAQAPGLALSSACFWSSSPQPPQPQVPETPWADEGGSVYHLTDEDFDQFVKEHSSVLVMFHAPCEWSLAPPHHILPPLSVGQTLLWDVSPVSTCLSDASSVPGMLWCPGRSPPSPYSQPTLHHCQNSTRVAMRRCVPQPNLADLTRFIQISMNWEMQMDFPELK